MSGRHGSKKPKRYTPPKCRKSMRGEPCNFVCRGTKFDSSLRIARSWLACSRCGKRKPSYLAEPLMATQAASVTVSADAIEAMRTMKHKIIL